MGGRHWVRTLGGGGADRPAGGRRRRSGQCRPAGRRRARCAGGTQARRPGSPRHRGADGTDARAPGQGGRGLPRVRHRPGLRERGEDRAGTGHACHAAHRGRGSRAAPGGPGTPAEGQGPASTRRSTHDIEKRASQRRTRPSPRSRMRSGTPSAIPTTTTQTVFKPTVNGSRRGLRTRRCSKLWAGRRVQRSSTAGGGSRRMGSSSRSSSTRRRALRPKRKRTAAYEKLRSSRHDHAKSATNCAAYQREVTATRSRSRPGHWTSRIYP